MISSADRSSRGNAPFLPASANQRMTSSRSRSGCSDARSCSSERSTSVWYSSHASSLKLLHPLIVGCVVIAFHPSCQTPREPSIEKNCVLRVEAADASSNEYRMLTPSKPLCTCPLISAGASTPRQSRIVGTRSIAWWYWFRTSPSAFMPAGHEMMHGSDVPPLNSYRFHILNGVLKALAQPSD